MKSKEEQVQLIGRQCELERQLSRLYSLFDKKFPMTKLWPYLLDEENKHECWLKQILPKVAEGSIYIYFNEVTVQAIEKLTEEIRTACAKADSEGVSLHNALTLSEKFEVHMLEKDFFHFMDSEYPEVSRVLDSLNEDTKKHRDMLIGARNKIIMGEKI